MRALTRKRLLAAVCMLLLMFASIAHAGAPGRPIDRPEGPPDPRPVEVGDPDSGNNGLVANWRQLFLRLFFFLRGLSPTGRSG